MAAENLDVYDSNLKQQYNAKHNAESRGPF